MRHGNIIRDATILLIFCFCPTILAKLQPRVFSEAYIEGTYRRFFEYTTTGNSASCPPIIEHKRSIILSFNGDAWIIPHDSIIENGVTCTHKGALTIYSYHGTSIMPDAISSNHQAEETFSLLQTQSTRFWMGVDARQCGEWNFPNPTFVFFVKESNRTITTSFRIKLSPGKKHMFIVTTSFTCIYGEIVQTSTTTPHPASHNRPHIQNIHTDTDPSAGNVGINETPSTIIQPVTAANPTRTAIVGNVNNGHPFTPDTSHTHDSLSILDIQNISATPSPAHLHSGPDMQDNAPLRPSMIPSPSASTTTIDEESLCFPGDATTELPDGSRVRMRDLAINAKIRVSTREYSHVFMFSHRKRGTWRKFVRIATACGREISLTEGHMLYVNGRLAAARDTKLGDLVRLAAGGDGVVKIVSRRWAEGLYNPHTLHGDIVVDGIVASTYTTRLDARKAHAVLGPVRAGWLMGMRVDLLENGSLGDWGMQSGP